jgi:hypothetical protein
MNLNKIIKEEIDDLQWIKDVEDPRYSNYYIIDNRSLGHSRSTFNYDDEWVLLKVIERHSNGDITYQDVERNLDDRTPWTPHCSTGTVEGYWFDFLLGLGPSAPEGYKGKLKPPHWFPHHGDTSYLPKNRQYRDCGKLNESDDLDWIRDVDISSYNPRDGEYIEAINVGDEEDYRRWLGDYFYSYDSYDYGETIKGVVKYSDEGSVFNLVEENTNDEIVFPFYEYIKVLNKEDPLDYGRLNIEYKPLFPLEAQIRMGGRG